MAEKSTPPAPRVVGDEEHYYGKRWKIGFDMAKLIFGRSFTIPGFLAKAYAAAIIAA
jgi:hypothetical protein